jgi:hypothetical protein
MYKYVLFHSQYEENDVDLQFAIRCVIIITRLFLVKAVLAEKDG